LKSDKSASVKDMLMAPQEVRAHCDLVIQTGRPRNLRFLASEISDFTRSGSFSCFWSAYGGREKVTQISKTGDVVKVLAMSVYLEFKKQILPHYYLTLP